MSRRPAHIPPRKAIPRPVIREVMKRSGGYCERDGCNEVGKDLDHEMPVALGGENTVENIRLLCRSHHAEKTASDVARIAKADAQGVRSGQQKRRKTGGSKWPKGRKLQGRGFTGSRKFNGEVIFK